MLHYASSTSTCDCCKSTHRHSHNCYLFCVFIIRQASELNQSYWRYLLAQVLATPAYTRRTFSYFPFPLLLAFVRHIGRETVIRLAHTRTHAHSLSSIRYIRRLKRNLRTRLLKLRQLSAQAPALPVVQGTLAVVLVSLSLSFTSHPALSSL